MKIADLTSALQNVSDRSEFDSWLHANDREISNFIFKLSGIELCDLGFDTLFYNTIFNSSVYEEYHNSKLRTDEFDGFLDLLAIAAEKLAKVGIDAPAHDLVPDLPASATKYRLLALNKFSLVDDIRTSYFAVFPEVLELLDRSRVEYEDGTIRPIVDVLVHYFIKAKKAFESKGLVNEMHHLRKQFRNKQYLHRYPFLNHQILVDLLADLDPFALYPADVKRTLLEPSTTIKALFFGINKEFYDHPRIDFNSDSICGHSRKGILDEVLVRGRGDFTKETAGVSPEEKVILYCFFNLKKHFFTSYAVFQTVLNSLQAFFRNDDYKPVFIDLGCGPMTSGLALADLIHSNVGAGIDFSYIGIDISEAMLSKAQSFQKMPIFSAKATFRFATNWNDVDAAELSKLAGANNPIIFNASYLFASSTLKAKDLCKYIRDVSKVYSNVYLVFQNPNNVDRNVKYEEFKQCIKHSCLLKRVENISYKAASKEANEDVYYEIIKF
jgi:hypothetical protein